MQRNLTASILLTLLMFTLVACSPPSSDTPVSERPLPTNEPAPTQEEAEFEEAAAPTTDNDSPSDIISTKIGEFRVAASHLQDEVMGSNAGENRKHLLVVLTHVDGTPLSPDTFSLEEFEENRETQMEIKWTETPDYSIDYLLKSEDDRFFAICSMGGWIDEEFVVGCEVPYPADEYWFHWGFAGENEPVLLKPEL